MAMHVITKDTTKECDLYLEVREGFPEGAIIE